MNGKSIEELKAIVKDGMILKSKTETITIQRQANNTIKLHNKLVKWSHLQDLLSNSDWTLVVNETQDEIQFDQKQEGWGGKREGAGAPKKKEKKKPTSFGLLPSVIQKLELLIDYHGVNKSEYLAQVITQDFDALPNYIKEKFNQN